MRNKSWVVGTAAMLVSAASLTACWPLDPLSDCAKNPYLSCFWSSRPSGSGGSGGGDGGTSVECIPSQNADAVADECGVFVATSGKDANNGAKGSPVATFSKAIALAKAGTGRVYACAEAFAEAVEVPAGVAVYGGLDCKTGWGHGSVEKTVIAPGADALPLRLIGGRALSISRI